MPVVVSPRVDDSVAPAVDGVKWMRSGIEWEDRSRPRLCGGGPARPCRRTCMSSHGGTAWPGGSQRAACSVARAVAALGGSDNVRHGALYRVRLLRRDEKPRAERNDQHVSPRGREASPDGPALPTQAGEQLDRHRAS